jgi:hypothetical protein
MHFNKQRYGGEPPLTSGPPCPKCGSPQTWLFPHTTEPPLRLRLLRTCVARGRGKGVDHSPPLLGEPAHLATLSVTSGLRPPMPSEPISQPRSIASSLIGAVLDQLDTFRFSTLPRTSSYASDASGRA